jgi:hypothetical protein
MRNVIDDRSGATIICCASTPYIACGSSIDGTASGSIMNIVMPAGELPRVVKGLNLSKLERRSGLRRFSVPRLGACGLTYSKCVKPGPYFGGA